MSLQKNIAEFFWREVRGESEKGRKRDLGIRGPGASQSTSMWQSHHFCSAAPNLSNNSFHTPIYGLKSIIQKTDQGQMGYHHPDLCHADQHRVG